MVTGIIFLVVLSILVLVHEMGHYLAARILGIKVEEFAFGLPFTKPIWKVKKGETQYSLYPLLFGGFVRLQGEEGPMIPDPPSHKASDGRTRSFWDRGRKQRMLVVAAGIIMNVILAFTGFMFLYSAVGVPVRRIERATVVEIQEGSPAQAAGLTENDRIVAVEGRAVTAAEFPLLMKSWAGLEVQLLVERGEGTYLFEGIVPGIVEQVIVKVTPRTNPPQGQGPVGVAIGNYPYVETSKCPVLSVGCLGRVVGAGVESTVIWTGRVFDGLRGIGKSLVAGKAPEGVAGPIGIYRLVDVVSQGGIWPLIELVAVLSINLAIFNLLPVPALDGGRMLFIGMEWVRGKRLDPKLEQRVNSWGMAFLIGLILLITLQDVVGSWGK